MGKTKILVVENETSKVREMAQFNIPVIEGDVRKEDALERAGIRMAKCLLASLDDSSNVLIALITKMLNSSLKVICKLEDVTNEAKLTNAAADEVISCYGALRR